MMNTLWLLKLFCTEPLFELLSHGVLEDRICFGPSFLPCGKAGRLQIPRCQGLAVASYGGTLGASDLKPSGFCNIGVYFLMNAP